MPSPPWHFLPEAPAPSVGSPHAQQALVLGQRVASEQAELPALGIRCAVRLGSRSSNVSKAPFAMIFLYLKKGTQVRIKQTEILFPRLWLEI